jgi:surfactin synthase thioesterase subunit
MKTHTTNYTNTLIEIAEDSPVSASVIPVVKNDKKTIAHYQYEKLSKHPLKYTSDELLFDIFVKEMTFRPQNWRKKNKSFFQRTSLFAHVAIGQEKWIRDFS